jgi:hypothetical protein
MVDIIIERHASGLTIEADKCDIPRWRACLLAKAGDNAPPELISYI